MTSFPEASGSPAIPQPTPPASTAVASSPPVASAFDRFVGHLFAPPVVIAPARAWLLLGLAGALAVWTDLLFYGVGMGINVMLWFAAIAGATVFAAARLGCAVPRDRLVVIGTAVALAGLPAFRDSGALKFFSLVAALALMGIGVGLPSGVGVRRMSPVAFVMALASCAVSLLTSQVRLAALLPRDAWRAEGRAGHTRLVVRSLLIAIPMLVVFGTLFASADAVFAEQLGRIFTFEASTIIEHGFWLLFGLWVATASLWAVAAVELPGEVVASVPGRHRLGRVEVGVVLGSLATLFALFVLVQVRYLFGGEDVVQTSIGLTYAEYARRGFFELVTVALLLLPVLAGINWARQQSTGASRVFLVLAALLIVLVLVIMGSAWQRMAMYREEFGLTELRFYVVTAMPLIGAALIWFFVSVWTRRVEQFLAGAMALGALTLFIVIAVNPDAVIAGTNAARIGEGREFDAHYVGMLSADAVPVLLDRREVLAAVLTSEQRCELSLALRERAESGDGVRTWNWSRWQAERQIAQHPQALLCN